MAFSSILTLVIIPTVLLVAVGLAVLCVLVKWAQRRRLTTLHRAQQRTAATHHLAELFRPRDTLGARVPGGAGGTGGTGGGGTSPRTAAAPPPLSYESNALMPPSYSVAVAVIPVDPCFPGPQVLQLQPFLPPSYEDLFKDGQRAQSQNAHSLSDCLDAIAPEPAENSPSHWPSRLPTGGARRLHASESANPPPQNTQNPLQTFTESLV